jgi:hypothetical protein
MKEFLTLKAISPILVLPTVIGKMTNLFDMKTYFSLTTRKTVYKKTV